MADDQSLTRLPGSNLSSWLGSKGAKTERIETTTVEMVCAQNGSKFVVVFERRPAMKQFKIVRREVVGARPPASGPRFERIVEKRVHRDEELDWTGWNCLSCGYPAGKGDTLFIRCSKCKRLVCGARVRQDGEKETFVCADDCGNAGTIVGFIDSYNGGTQTSQRALPGGPDNRTLGTGDAQRLLKGRE